VENKNAQDKRTLAVNIKYSTGRTGSAAGLEIQAYNADVTEYPGTYTRLKCVHILYLPFKSQASTIRKSRTLDMQIFSQVTGLEVEMTGIFLKRYTAQTVYTVRKT
jgi:hypothetical protein